MPREQLDHVATRIGLRAPRVAIVFDAAGGGHHGDGWIAVARAALTRANELWGGAGFVLIPHIDGTVTGEVLRVLRAYDPDFVVPFESPPGPEMATVTSTSSDVGADPPARPSLATLNAVESVALACSPHRRWLSPEQGPVGGDRSGSCVSGACAALDRLPWCADMIGWELEGADLGEGTSGPLTPVSALRVEGAMWLHSPPSLTGALGLALAARVGSVAEPSHDGSTADKPARPTHPLDPTVASKEADDIVGYLTGPSDKGAHLPHWLAHHPAGLELGVIARDQPAAWTRTTTGLAHLVSGSRLRVRHVVVGDTADDFALHLLLDRLYGNAVWLHADWAPRSARPWSGAASQALTRLLANTRRGRSYEIAVTSASLPPGALEPLLTEGGPLHECDSQEGFAGDDDNPQPPPSPRKRDRPPRVRLETPVKLPERGCLHLGVYAEFEKQVFLPAQVSSTGRITLTSSLDPISPSNPDLAQCPALSWQIDVDLHRPLLEPKPLRMPFGRGFDGHALVPTEDERYQTWVRSSRSGITFDSRKYDFVAAGAIGDQHLARPRLQRLDLAAWINALARQGGRRTEPSDAGTRADLLANLWGGRAALAEAFSGPFNDLVAKFSQTGDSTSKAYPDKDGVLLPGSIGVLKYAGLSAPWAGGSPEEIRRTLDDLVMRGIIRRGLVLRCSACRNLGFTEVGALANTNTCSRCGNPTPLRLEAWRNPISDPEWHYELHPIVRDFVRENGQAPLWLAHHLGQGARSYSDVSETNLFVGESRRPIAEADLVAHVDGRLLTAEVKTTDELDSTRDKRKAAARKRVMWARLVNADEIVLATTKSTWQQASIDSMRTAMQDAAEADVWLPGGAPTLRLVHNLGSDVTQEVIDPY